MSADEAAWPDLADAERVATLEEADNHGLRRRNMPS